MNSIVLVKICKENIDKKLVANIFPVDISSQGPFQYQ